MSTRRPARGGAGRARASPGPTRGGNPARGRGGGTQPQSDLVQWTLADRLKTVGQRRPNFATVGQRTQIEVNAFGVEIRSQLIHQYDVVIIPSSTSHDFNRRVFRALQDEHPTVFTVKAAYDGRSIMVTPKKLVFADGGDSGTVAVALPSNRPGAAPEPFEVKLTRVAEVPLQSLEGFVTGSETRSNESITGITALNIALREDPSFKFPLRGKSFFIREMGSKYIGGGIELRSGLFQSLRPGIDRAFLNVNVTTAMMYRTGSLLDLCIDVLDLRGPGAEQAFTPGSPGFDEANRKIVERFITGVKVFVPTTGQKKRTVRGLTSRGASQLRFDVEGTPTTVADYFRRLNYPVSKPNVICAQIGERALIPLELCTVAPDQIIKKQIPAHKTNAFVDFARKTPQERFNAIRSGVPLLGHAYSDYVRDFGMNVDVTSLIKVDARKLPAPKLLHGPGSKQPDAAPFNGSWNMADKHVYKPCPPLTHWLMIVLDNRLNDNTCQEVSRAMMAEARKLGMRIEAAPAIIRANGGGDLIAQLQRIVPDYAKTQKASPQMLFIILPEGGDQLRLQAKWFGTFTKNGIATQCVKSFKCRGAKPQYWANVLIQMNAKLGGINSIPDPSLSASLADTRTPTIVMGADVAHPSPGPEGPPSFAALVWSIDPNHMKYNARDSIQTGRLEMIADFKAMALHAFRNFNQHRKVWPKRVIFFRDGVSEGQFEHVKEKEMLVLKEILRELKISANVTYCIVGKRHHIRFNALNDRDKDRKSGNVLAGTVVDTGITHPVENDFYLASHGGIIGTSRPAHYSIIQDDNNFTADEQEQIFYSLCHGYASCTRSVSIPIPVYYADKACEYAKFRFNPNRPMAPSGDQSGAQFFEKLKEEFDARPLSIYASSNMYFA